MGERAYKGVRRICLIGSGDLMADTADVLVRHGYSVGAILAPRHADETLPLTGGIIRTRLQAAGVYTQVADDINDLASWPVSDLAGKDALAVCFGPAWIFSAAVIGSFGFGMINVNPIPVPRYLGGAHYTWQILNGDRHGGCFLQDVTDNVDKGDILLSHEFGIPQGARVPQDYFQIYFEQSQHCLRTFIRALSEGAPLRTIPFDTVESRRLYFPRVLTVEQAYIDWSWAVEAIVRFCNAFDRPYAGAMTFLQDTLVRVKDVERVQELGDFHPFAAGLIVRRLDSEVIVAALGGALRLGSVEDADGKDIKPRMREGRRLLTPRERLEHALAFHPRLSAQGFARSGVSAK